MTPLSDDFERQLSCWLKQNSAKNADQARHRHNQKAKKQLYALQAGEIHIQQTIDLHQQTLDEAQENLERFLGTTKRNGCRYLCIIHGKGHHSPHGHSVIKHWLNQHFKNHPHIAAFGPASMEDGGEGATLVILK